MANNNEMAKVNAGGTVNAGGYLRIRLVKSLNGRLDSHIATANSLGLHKIGN